MPPARPARFARALIRTATRHYPLLRGAGRLSRTAPLAALVDRDELVTTTLRDGSRILVHSGDYLGAPIFYTGGYDRRLTKLLERTLRPGDHVWDLGANYGVYALPAARLVGPTGSVHAVEAQPPLAELLGRSARCNGYAHLHVHALALSDRDGTARMTVPHTNSGGGQLADLGPGHFALEVPTRHAGHFFAQHATPPIRLLKMDIEGHEHVVLNAAADFLRQHPPAAVVFEAHGLHQAPAQRPVAQQLGGMGYRLFAFRSTLRRVAFVPIEQHDDPTSIDFLALHPDHAEPELFRKLGVARG